MPTAKVALPNPSAAMKLRRPHLSSLDNCGRGKAGAGATTGDASSPLRFGARGALGTSRAFFRVDIGTILTCVNVKQSDSQLRNALE